MEVIHVACPCCKNRRLFDLAPEENYGTISIKCPQCRAVVAVTYKNRKMSSRHLQEYSRRMK